MHDFSARVLAQLEPDSVVAKSDGWQQRKSVEMRIAVLEATIDCIQRHGYAGTTVQLITEAAGVSRGAMLHHYATKMKLMAAVIEYTFYRHMAQFLKRLTEQGTVETLPIEAITEYYWSSVQGREYAVYLELGVAARTDPEMRAMFVEAAARVDRVWSEEMVRSFPQWAGRSSQMMLANDLTVALFIGMLVNRTIWDESRIERVKGTAVRVIELIRIGEL